MLNLRKLWARARSAAIVLAMTISVSPCTFSQSLEVIPLKYRTAEQVIPALKPLLDKSGSISGMQNQLIVRTTPANLAELKRVLASLDTVPRRLLITVRQDAEASRDQSAADVSGRISSGTATVTVPGSVGGPGGGSVTIRQGNDIVRGRVDSTRSLDSDNNVQTIQVLEGNSAFIRIGQSVPIRQGIGNRTIINGRIVESGGGVDYRDVTTGFQVLPRVTGDTVTLDINPQRDTLARPEQNLPPGSINVQSASTTVSGRLGEWIEVGGVVQGVSDQRSAVLGSTRTLTSDNRRILLKVDEIR